MEKAGGNDSEYQTSGLWWQINGQVHIIFKSEESLELTRRETLLIFPHIHHSESRYVTTDNQWL